MTIYPSNYLFSQTDKQIFLLVGHEKYRDDLIDFFYEMHFVKCESLSISDRAGTFVICDFERAPYFSQITELGLVYKTDYLWIDDLINVLQEPEAYYTAAYFKGRPIVVMGNGQQCEILIKSNPSMRVHAFYDISDWEQGVAETMPALLDIGQTPLFILCTDEFAHAKKAMIAAGYAFGDDFYFYDESNARLASMLENVIKCEVVEPLNCSINKAPALVFKDGTVNNCCFRMTEPCGNIMLNTLENIFASPKARILHLSTRNRSYCYCTDYCKYINTQANPIIGRNELEMPIISDYRAHPTYLRACNLTCRFCRNHIENDDSEPQTLHIHEEFLASLAKIKGMGTTSGEPLFSKMYWELMEADPSDYFRFTTNGTLLNGKNWDKLLNLYKDISVDISIDAATKETYEYLRRGAKWESMLENIMLTADLRRSGKIKEFTFACVVQKDNFRELHKIIELAREAHVDRILFQRLLNFGSFPDEFVQYDVHDPQSPYHNEFVQTIATNPIFWDPDVNFKGLIHVLKAAGVLLQKQIIELARKNEELDNQIHDIYSSNTWKIGDRLRRVYRWIVPVSEKR